MERWIDGRPPSADCTLHGSVQLLSASASCLSAPAAASAPSRQGCVYSCGYQTIFPNGMGAGLETPVPMWGYGLWERADLLRYRDLHPDDDVAYLCPEYKMLDTGQVTCLHSDITQTGPSLLVFHH